jgi:hypothetical protein
MSRRSGVGIGLLGLLAALPLVAGCGGGSAKDDSGATIVPATAPAYIAIDTDQSSEQWQAASRLADRFPGKQKAVSSVERSLKEGAGLDWKTDIEPALGSEIDIAWLDFAGGGNDVVGLVKPKDEQAFERLVARGNAKDTTSKLLYEKVGEWEALSDKQAVLDRFRSESKAATAMLADDPSFVRAMDAVSNDSLLRAYVNGTKVMETVRQQGDQSVDQLVAKAGTLEWLVAGVGATSEGVRFDAVVRGTPGKLLQGNGGQVLFHPTLPSTVPGNTLLYLSFHGSKGMFGSLDKDVPQLDTEQMAPVRKLIGELGALLEGEDAIYVRNPPPGSKLPEITLLAVPGSSVDGAATLDRVLNDPKLNLDQRPQPATIGGVSARELDFGQFKLDYADVNDKLIVTDGPSGIRAVADPAGTLADDQNYSDAAGGSGLPDKTQGFLYVNVTGGLALGQRLAGAPIPKAVKRNLGPLRSAIEYGVSRPSEIQVTFFLRIE